MPEGVPGPVDLPAELSPLEHCLMAGGALEELWSTSNQHGAVTSLAVSGSVIVLGSEDGSVKTWSVDGTSPSYGTPLLEDTGVVVDGLAFSDDGHVLGVDRGGRLSEWRVEDAHPARSTLVGELPLAAVAASPDGRLAAVAAGLESNVIYTITRDTGERSAPLPTTLWGTSSVAFAGDDLFTAGHWYGVPMIEQRSRTAPADVTADWSDQELQASVHAIAVDRAMTQLVAVGDGFVAVFDPRALDAGPTSFQQVAGHGAVGTVRLGREMFATVGAEGSLRVWSAAAEPLGNLSIPPAVGVGIDAGGERLFTAGPDGDLHAFACR